MRICHLISRPNIITSFVGTVCAAGYFYWSTRSNLSLGISLFEFLGSYFFITTVLFGYFYYCVSRNLQLNYAIVIAWAIIFRLIGIYGSPILEDDHFRYLLDGCMFVTYGTPYGIPPASLFAQNDLPSECQILLSQVNYPNLPTIYAPVLQYIFAAMHLLSSANIETLQWFVSIVDIGLIVLLSRYAPPHYVLLYAWCPLVIKEISFTAHPDIVGIGLLFAAFHLRKINKPLIAAVVLAMACATKVFAVLFVPFVLFALAPRYWLAFGFMLGLLYLPFVFNGATDLTVLGIFAHHWQFNALLFQPVATYFGGPAARIICLALFAAWYFSYFMRWRKSNEIGIPHGEWVFGMFLLFSPVVNPWYLIWLLPFAVMRPPIWAWASTIAVVFSYATGLHYFATPLESDEILPSAYLIQILILGSALAADWWRTTLRR